MTAQELLEALNKARNGTSLDQVAVWALTNIYRRLGKTHLIKKSGLSIWARR